MRRIHGADVTITVSSPNVERIIELSKEVDAHNRKMQDLLEEMYTLGSRPLVNVKEINTNSDSEIIFSG